MLAALGYKENLIIHRTTLPICSKTKVVKKSRAEKGISLGFFPKTTYFSQLGIKKSACLMQWVQQKAFGKLQAILMFFQLKQIRMR